MLLLAVLLGLVLLAAAVAAPSPGEGPEAPEGPAEAWTNGPARDAALAPVAAVERPCGRDMPGAARRPAPDDGDIAAARTGDVAERPAVGEPGGLRDKACPPGEGAAEPSASACAGVPLIADFDPAVETIEIAYAGDAPPELRFVETAEATEVLVDGVVVARMAGVSGLDPSHVTLIAA